MVTLEVGFLMRLLLPLHSSNKALVVEGTEESFCLREVCFAIIGKKVLWSHVTKTVFIWPTCKRTYVAENPKAWW